MKSFVPVAGVDVSKRYSDLCVLSPDNNVMLRQKIYHDMVSMKLAEKKLHEIELEYGTRPVVVMGIYVALPSHPVPVLHGCRL